MNSDWVVDLVIYRRLVVLRRLRTGPCRRWPAITLRRRVMAGCFSLIGVIGDDTLGCTAVSFTLGCAALSDGSLSSGIMCGPAGCVGSWG